VLRGCPHYDWQLAHEARFAELLHERTLAPVPWPYRVCESSEIFGWGFAILPRLPGLHVAQPDVRAGLSRDDLRDIAGALGGTLGELQALSWPSPAVYDPARAAAGWRVSGVFDLMEGLREFAEPFLEPPRA
jgi:aminoglycoside phosphotransferase (APT) family kinase protein